MIFGSSICEKGHVALTCGDDADGKNRVVVWDLRTGKHIRSLVGHEDWVYSCALSADGKYAITGSSDKISIFWDVGEGECLHSLKGHTGVVYACSLSEDGAVGLSASSDNTLILWDTKSGTKKALLEGHTHWVRCCKLSPDGKYALSGDWDGRCIFWETKNAISIKDMSLENKGVGVLTCALIPGSPMRALIETSDGGLYLWNIEANTKVVLEGIHKDWVTSCAVSQNGKVGVTVSADGRCFIWNLETDAILLRPENQHTGYVSSCCISPDSHLMITTGYDGHVHVASIKHSGHFLSPKLADRVSSIPDTKISKNNNDGDLVAKINTVADPPSSGNHALDRAQNQKSSTSWDETCTLMGFNCIMS